MIDKSGFLTRAKDMALAKFGSEKIAFRYQQIPRL